MSVEKDLELHAIIQEMHHKGNENSNKKQEVPFKWTKEDVDRLLEETDRTQNKSSTQKGKNVAANNAKASKPQVAQKNADNVKRQSGIGNVGTAEKKKTQSGKEQEVQKKRTEVNQRQRMSPAVKPETVRSAAAKPTEKKAVDIANNISEPSRTSDARVKDIMNETTPRNSGSKFGAAMKTARMKLSELFAAMKIEDDEEDEEEFIKQEEEQPEKKGKRGFTSDEKKSASEPRRRNDDSDIRPVRTENYERRERSPRPSGDVRHERRESQRISTHVSDGSINHEESPELIAKKEAQRRELEKNIRRADDKENYLSPTAKKKISGKTAEFDIKKIDSAKTKTMLSSFDAESVQSEIHNENGAEADTVSFNSAIEKPDKIIEKGKKIAESPELDSTPIITPDDNAVDEPKTPYIKGLDDNIQVSDDLKRQIHDAMMNGQIVLDGFEEIGDEPVSISESQAERELFEKRREKINKFTLFGDDDESDPYGSEEEKIGELFDSANEKPPRDDKNEDYLGVEYKQTRDAKRVQRYLVNQKKKSFKRIIANGIFLFVAFIIGIISAVQSSIAGDRILTIFINLICIMFAMLTSNQMIVNSLMRFKQKKIDIGTAVSIAAIVSFLQNVLMMVLYFVNASELNTVSVFSGVGVAALFIGEVNGYFVYSRTIDSMSMCVGEIKDNLYSVESLQDDNDIVELAKNVKSPSLRIKYSCRTRFPSRIIELCTSSTSSDKLMKLMLPLIMVLGLINLITAWLVHEDFATGFAAFSATVAMSVPAYGALLIQLPLTWANKSFGSKGMISCQESVEELCKTNTILLDSKDLFDQNRCIVHDFHDFENVRLDDAMLYAVALTVRSSGPMTGAFDNIVVNRHDLLPQVKSFAFEEKLGVTGWIKGQKVLMGTRQMMENHNITIPDEVDEDRYHLAGYEVMYVAIAHTLALMLALEYVPDMSLAPYLKKLHDSGVNILVRNCDPNVSEKMISYCFDMELDNIKIVGASSGRIFKKYKSKPKVATRATCIYDGSTEIFLRSLCMAETLRHVFKISNILMLAGTFICFGIMLVLSIINVVSDLPAVLAIFLPIIIAGAFTGIIRILSSK